jgi:malonyl-CoA/methylmalonyl-CoA synthetase
MADTTDRTFFVPKHRGPNVLPNSPLFNQILRFAHRSERIAIKDPAAGFAASYIQLLTDVVHLRNLLQESLDSLILEKLGKGAEVFINVLGEGGYEFTVAFFAIIAIGAVVAPLCKWRPVLADLCDNWQ